MQQAKKVQKETQKEFLVDEICGWFKISRQAHSQYQKAQQRREEKEEKVLSYVRQVRKKHPKMGTRKLHQKLKEKIDMGRDKLFELLKRHNLYVKPYRGPRTTFSGRLRFPNLIKDIEIVSSDQAWVTDITYIPSDEGFLYLALVTDLYSRTILGYDLSASLTADGAIRALKMAIKRSPKKLEGLIHHSDHGIQYTCKEYQAILDKHGIRCSMGEVGNCYDNAVAERVNGILKIEYLLNERFVNLKQTKRAVRESIALYNNDRPHLSLAYQTPIQVYTSVNSIEIKA